MYECLKNGLSFKVSKGNVLQLCPALTITLDQLEAALAILKKPFKPLKIDLLVTKINFQLKTQHNTEQKSEPKNKKYLR